MNFWTRLWFLAALLGLLACTVLHSLWSTSLDSLTYDEPYHIAAGATYLRWHDYRLNPEHPPLVKLVVALNEPASLLKLPTFREFGKIDDKTQERQYTQGAVYLMSDYHRVQRHARTAMLLLNTVLLGLTCLALSRVFSPSIALVSLLFLALDPTICAHMPVVMTDLPLALAATLTTALAFLATRSGRWRDWLLFGLGQGVLLSIKHSAPMFLLPLLAGCVATLIWRHFRSSDRGLGKQALRLVSSATLGLAVLWASYSFHYWESFDRDAKGQHVDTYNRALDDKITDLQSRPVQAVLRSAQKYHVVPRAYLWGLADTLRAGVEGRPQPVFVFGHYLWKVPWWTALADYAVKVPLPFTLFALAGVLLLILRRTPPLQTVALTWFFVLMCVVMAFISTNRVFYAGLRHWLFMVSFLSIFAAVATIWCLQQRRMLTRVLPAVALLLIALPVLPQRRIWEYANVLAGGSGNAWHGFANESMEMGQRSDELVRFWKANMAGANVFFGYPTMREQLKAEHLQRWEPKPEEVESRDLDAWFVTDNLWLPAKHWEHFEPLRDAPTIAHIGNVFIWRGKYHMPYLAGGMLQRSGMHELMDRGGDQQKAEYYLLRAVQLNPELTFAEMELGNINLCRHDNAAAIAHYKAAIIAEHDSEQIREAFREQIKKLEASPTASVAPLRLDRE